MPMLNAMTELLNKIERRLGTEVLNLPEDMNKDVWADEVIANESLDTFSRYFPAKMTYYLTGDRRKGPYYLIDEAVCKSVKILGCGDIDWHLLSKCTPAFGFGSGFYSTFDMFTTGLNTEDIMMSQMMIDHASVYKCGIYVEFDPPNKVRLESNLSNNMLEMLKSIPITLFIKHSPNLMTIEPTKMETFERLATCDVATFLYNTLKYFTNIETAFASTELQLDTLSDWANRREEVVQYMEENYVSASNKNMPIMLTI